MDPKAHNLPLNLPTISGLVPWEGILMSSKDTGPRPAVPTSHPFVCTRLFLTWLLLPFVFYVNRINKFEETLIQVTHCTRCVNSILNLPSLESMVMLPSPRP